MSGGRHWRRILGVQSTGDGSSQNILFCRPHMGQCSARGNLLYYNGRKSLLVDGNTRQTTAMRRDIRTKIWEFRCHRDDHHLFYGIDVHDFTNWVQVFYHTPHIERIPTAAALSSAVHQERAVCKFAPRHRDGPIADLVHAHVDHARHADQNPARVSSPGVPVDVHEVVIFGRTI